MSLILLPLNTAKDAVLVEQKFGTSFGVDDNGGSLTIDTAGGPIAATISGQPISTTISGQPITANLLTDYFLEIAKGNITGHSVLQMASKNPSTGASFEDIWDVGVLSTLDYDAQTANFTAGLILTGGTSTATARIVRDVDNGTTGVLYVRAVSGTFQDNEVITDSSTGSADADGIVAPIRALVYPTAGEQWAVICENTNDSSAGTGARTIEVTFMEEATRLYTTETISLNGQTAVNFSSSDAYRFRRAKVLTWGSNTDPVYGKSNLGTIMIYDTSTDNLRGAITFDDAITGDEYGLNNSLDSHYTVEVDKVVFPIFRTNNVTKSNDAVIRALGRLDGTDGFITLGESSNYQSSFAEDFSKGSVGLPESTDIKLIARSTNNSVHVNVQVIVIIVDESLVSSSLLSLLNFG